ncbi:MAG: DoxX family membrane protein [Bacteriovoracia bacterium]
MDKYLGNGVHHIGQLLASLFLAILFLQSGLDKVFDWKGNLSYFKSHFSKSPLKASVPLLLPVITIFETAAGVLCGLGVLEIIAKSTMHFAFAGTVVAGLNIVMLFFGQRMAKDYEGAAVLASYFVLILFALNLYR